MASTVTFRVDGLKELGERMRKLSEKVALKAAASATSGAASLVKKTAKRTLLANSKETGLLEKNVIAKKVSKSRTTLTSEHIVTVKKATYVRDGEKVSTRKTGSFVEYGTVKMAPEPWLRPALANNIQPAINVMKDRLAKAITKGGA